MLMDPPNKPPPNVQKVVDDFPPDDEDSIETRNPIDFGDIGYGDISTFLNFGSNITVRVIGSKADVGSPVNNEIGMPQNGSNEIKYICLETSRNLKDGEPFTFRQWVPYEDAVNFMHSPHFIRGDAAIAESIRQSKEEDGTETNEGVCLTEFRKGFGIQPM